ncbi:hypothetical protein C6W96_17010 [Streptomyces sp. CS149]|nr:hypothetical protein C6W96_17010 [Streptomyces sp. CS149]
MLIRTGSRDDLGPHQDPRVEDPDEGTQFTRALPGQEMQHGFEVLAKPGPVASTFREATIRTRQWVHKVSEWAVGKSFPVPEGFFRGLGPEAGALQPTQISGTRP